MNAPKSPEEAIHAPRPTRAGTAAQPPGEIAAVERRQAVPLAQQHEAVRIGQSGGERVAPAATSGTGSLEQLQLIPDGRAAWSGEPTEPRRTVNALVLPA